ncbi:RDD family protein [Dokdonella sp.]|uniref:RDD family protein n=1 Tax=Dokdonella sp. TaxID=2291710 RepID=UPI0027BAD152|nr:RDD family protein [Dokdonella sp.]
MSSAPPPPPPPHNPYAAPSARVQDVVSDDSLELAERVIRLGAYLLDTAVIAIPAILLAIVLPFAAGATAEGGTRAPGLGFTIGMTVFGLYALGVLVVNLIWLHRHGQTIGKRLLKVRIVRTSGERCGLLRIIFARYVPVGLLGAIPLVGWLVMLADPLLIFREDRRCLHDLIADTMVVKTT